MSASQADIARLALRPLRPEADRALLEAWMCAPHCAPWWEVADLDDPACAHLERLVATADGEPVGYVETYRVTEDALGARVDAAGGDRGFHLLIGPVELLGTGLADRLARLVLRRLFAEPGVARVLCEPDARNVRMIAFCRRVGAATLTEVQLPGKRALVLAWSAEP